jgi:hypothetical protein
MLLIPALPFAGDGIQMSSNPMSRKRGANLATYV